MNKTHQQILGCPISIFNIIIFILVLSITDEIFRINNLLFFEFNYALPFFLITIVINIGLIIIYSLNKYKEKSLQIILYIIFIVVYFQTKVSFNFFSNIFTKYLT